MSNSPVQKSVELQVSDFGPIAEAKIDLRPLTVFVGPSNTGKSYLSILIYAMHRVFSRNRMPFIAPVLNNFAFPDRNEKLIEEFMVALNKRAHEPSGSKKPSDEESIFLPSPVMDMVDSLLNQSGEAIDWEISRCFGIDKTAVLVRRGRKKRARISLRSVADCLRDSGHELTLDIRKKAGLKAKISREGPIRIKITDAEHIESCLREINAQKDASERKRLSFDLMARLNQFALPSIVAPLHLPAYYLPAGRTGMIHSHSVVVSTLIGSAATAMERSAIKTPMLSGMLADFLEQLIEAGQKEGRRPKGKQDFGSDIEKEILKGSVEVEGSSATGYPRFSYQPAGWKEPLPLMNASSMISELAPVVLYLRHMVSRGNVLIIEEPESHLHPAMQVEFMRQLAVLVRSGIRVIVTTHSEWLLEELSNIVRRFEIPESERDGTANGRVGLSCEQVGVWLFDQKPGEGSVVKEIRLDSDSGLYPSDFYDVAVALHNEWADISGRIEETP